MGADRLAGVVAVLLLLIGCTAATDEDGPELVFTEIIVAPVDPEAALGSPKTIGVATVRLSNRGPGPARVTEVLPAPAPGLEVHYLGHTDCRRGCAGAGIWDESTRELVAQGVDGTAGFTLQAGELRMLVLRLELTPTGRELVRTRCLAVERVVLHLEGGRSVSVGAVDDSYVAGVHSDHRPVVPYTDCRGELVPPSRSPAPAPAPA